MKTNNKTEKPTLEEILEVAEFEYNEDGTVICVGLSTDLIGKHKGNHAGDHWGDHIGHHWGDHWGNHIGEHIGEHVRAEEFADHSSEKTIKEEIK